MVDFDGIKKAAEDLGSKAGDLLHSEKAEELSDKALDAAEGLANKVTGDKFADQVASVKETIDKNIGDK